MSLFNRVGEKLSQLEDLKEQGRPKKGLSKNYTSGVVQKRGWNIEENSASDNKVTSKSVYKKAVTFARDFLNNFNVGGRVDIKFNTVRNASYTEKGIIENGDINLDVQIRTLSGVKIKGELNIPIRSSQLLEPSVIIINGNARVIAQSTFDDIVKRGTFKRNRFKGPEQLVNPELLKRYQNNEYPYVNFGEFGVE